MSRLPARMQQIRGLKGNIAEAGRKLLRDCHASGALSCAKGRRGFEKNPYPGIRKLFVP